MSRIGVVVTSFGQGGLVAEAVRSALDQTRPPEIVVVVDDGSTDSESLLVLRELETQPDVQVLRQTNSGVSAARNAGLRALTTELAVVLDGDDRIAPTFVERTAAVLEADPDVLAASAWLRMHGVADALVCPRGGTVRDFLDRNACPATVLLRREVSLRTGGYPEEMREGFEDWDFFLTLLTDGGRVAIVEEPLIQYRTAPDSANVRSMERRLELYAEIVDRHEPVFRRHLKDVLIAHEARSIAALARWEDHMVANPTIPIEQATYGDGGMAAVVRIATRRQDVATDAANSRPRTGMPGGPTRE